MKRITTPNTLMRNLVIKPIRPISSLK